MKGDNSYYDPNHKYKIANVRNNLTCHLRDPINRARVELISELEGFSSPSQWLAHVIEDEVLPERISKISKLIKENEHETV